MKTKRALAHFSLKSRKNALCLFSFLIIALAVLMPSFASNQAQAASIYYFSSFGSDSNQNLYMYYSTNSTSFTQFYTGFNGPTGVLRDPALLRRNGKYYIAFTIRSWTTSSTSFAIASSYDMKNWTTIATVPCGVSGTYYTWAPDWYVEGGNVYLIVNIGPSGSMQPYIFTAQNTDLTSWSSPVAMGIGTNHIDAFVVKSGSTYHCYCKNESSKNIERWTASSLTGAWTLKSTYWNGYEGPCLIQLDNGTWRIYVDHYSSGDGYYSATSSDLVNWTSLTKLSFGRHGSCVKLTSNYLKNVSTGLYIDGLGYTTNGSNCGQWASSGSANQQFIITAVGSYYTIMDCSTGMFLDGMGRTASGSICGQYTYSGSNNQMWIRETAGSYYKFKNVTSGLYLDGNGSTGNGANLLQNSSSSSTTQQWQIQ